MPGKHAPPEVRFWRHVRKGDGCWEWTSSYFDKGYGQFKAISGQAPIRAHRYSWELHNGPVPEGLHVLHHCDNPPCVRPDHLFVGTPKDNTGDMLEKERGPFTWERQQGPRKLTDWDIAEIRARRGEAVRVIARDYGVHHSTIVRLLNGVHWKTTTTKGS